MCWIEFYLFFFVLFELTRYMHSYRCIHLFGYLVNSMLCILLIKSTIRPNFFRGKNVGVFTALIASDMHTGSYYEESDLLCKE